MTGYALSLHDSAFWLAIAVPDELDDAYPASLGRFLPGLEMPGVVLRRLWKVALVWVAPSGNIKLSRSSVFNLPLAEEAKI